ncbi:rhodanese-like domain-containing protein [Streptomyces sp. NRRL F-5123]|uniref:rhodanese-like domain-containing protein n=1 Tax=Streptomyces sp. NRRL F-5123 TaxID=1463856 RepID=UPI0004E12FBE|nr:rhodanese-like domain-containing protein [Streptomyces sp. NRRL F-5123]
MATTTSLDARQARARLDDLTVIDVRTAGEYAGGHIPGALNVPLDRLDDALPGIRDAAERGPVLVVCASGARSENACRTLARHGIEAATLTGGTGAWAAEGHDLARPQGSPRAVWAMERQVRFTASLIILLGLALGFFVHPAFLLLSAGICGGLIFSALTDTCGMAVVLGKLPHNRPRAADLDATLARLRGR